MKLIFNTDQLMLLKKLELDFDVQSELSDEQYYLIDEKVNDFFAMHGLAGNGDEINETGETCESIMDILSAQ